MRVIRRHFPVWAPTVSLFRWLLFVDHVDLAAPRAQTRWMRAGPRKRTTRSRRTGEATTADALIGRPRGEADVARKEQDVWVVRGMAWRQHSQPREEGAGSPAGAGLGGWSRKIID